MNLSMNLAPSSPNENFEVLSFIVDDAERFHLDLLEFARAPRGRIVNQTILRRDALHNPMHHVWKCIKVIREPRKPTAFLGEHLQESLRLNEIHASRIA